MSDLPCAGEYISCANVLYELDLDSNWQESPLFEHINTLFPKKL